MALNCQWKPCVVSSIHGLCVCVWTPVRFKEEKRGFVYEPFIYSSAIIHRPYWVWLFVCVLVRVYLILCMSICSSNAESFAQTSVCQWKFGEFPESVSLCVFACVISVCMWESVCVWLSKPTYPDSDPISNMDGQTPPLPSTPLSFLRPSLPLLSAVWVWLLPPSPALLGDDVCDAWYMVIPVLCLCFCVCVLCFK